MYIMILMTSLLILADYLIKKATISANHFTVLMSAAVMLYAISPFGWFYVLSSYKLVSVGAIYSIMTIVMLALIGVVFFHEHLSRQEMAGLVLAFLSIYLLSTE